MRIVKIDCIPIGWACPVVADAMNVTGTRKALVIRLETDGGLVGYGEAFLYGCSPLAGKMIIEDHLAPVLMGQEVSLARIEKMWDSLFWNTLAFGKRGIILGLISGIDIALWDLVGKIEQCPIAALLGKKHDTIPSYASCGFYGESKGLPEFREEMERCYTKGYRNVKIKVGRNDREGSINQYALNKDFRVSIEEDFKRISIANEVFGIGNVAIDPNMTWTIDYAVEYKEQLRACSLWWIEEPLYSKDLAALQALEAIVRPTPIAGYETEQGVDFFQRLITEGRVDILQPDIGWAGGFTECAKIMHLAEEHDKVVSLHSFGSVIHMAASLHLAAACGNLEKIESEENTNALRSQLAKQPLAVDGDMNYLVPEKPGLGIDLDLDKLETYRIR
jgi:D-galactarolactone cycloisomerase